MKPPKLPEVIKIGRFCADLVRTPEGEKVAVAASAELAAEIVRRWNAHDELVGALWDITRNTTSAKEAISEAMRTLSRLGG